MERQVQVGMQIERDVMVPMRDGALMATDIYRRITQAQLSRYWS